MQPAPKETPIVIDDVTKALLIRSLKRRTIVNAMWTATLFLATVATALLAASLWQLNSSLQDSARFLAPTMKIALEAFDTTTVSATGTLHNVLSTSESGATATRVTVPLLLDIIGSVARTVARLEAVLQHPRIEVALGQPIEAQSSM